MLKFTYKLLVVTLLSSTLIGLLALFVFAKEGIYNDAKYYDKVSYLEKANYDFKVYNPLEEQINELIDSESVDQVFPFYKSNMQIQIDGQDTAKTVIAIFAEEKYDLNLTEFNETRLIKQMNNSSNLDEIFIDLKTATSIRAKIGDTIHIVINGEDKATFTLTRIYESFNFYTESVIFFYYTDSIKEHIDKDLSANRKLSGSYLKSNNLIMTKQNLANNYIPLGDLLPYVPEYFSSQVEYDQYVEDYIEDHKGTQIFSKYEVLDQVKINNHYLIESANSSLYTTFFILLVGTVLISLKVLYGFKEAKSMENFSNSNIKKDYFLISFVFTDVIIALSLLGLIIIFKQFIEENLYQYAFLTKTIRLSMIGVFCATVINLSISVFSSRFLNRNTLVSIRRKI